MSSILTSYSQVQKLYEEAQIKGVGVVVEHPTCPKILLVKETETKLGLGKLADMRSCLLETAESGESVRANFLRAMKEEAPGIDYVEVREQGYYQISQDAWALVFVVQSLSPALPRFTAMSDVCEPEWIEPESALKERSLRQGVKEIIVDYIRGKSRVCCTECERPFLS